MYFQYKQSMYVIILLPMQERYCLADIVLLASHFIITTTWKCYIPIILTDAPWTMASQAIPQQKNSPGQIINKEFRWLALVANWVKVTENWCVRNFSLSLYTLVASNRLQLCYDLGASHTGCVVTVSGVSLQSYRSISELGIPHVKSSVDLFQPMKMLHFHQCWSYEDPLLRIP